MAENNKLSDKVNNPKQATPRTSAPKKPSSKKIIIFVSIVLALLLFPPVRTGLLTVPVFVNIAVQEGNWRPLQLISRKPTIEKHVILSSSDRVLEADLYLPAGKKQHAAFVVVAPFAHGGLQDPRLVNLAMTFSRAGFAVLIPWHEKGQVLQPKEVEDVIASFMFLQKHPRVNTARIGLFGISYGTGPVMLAAVDRRIQDNVQFLVSFNGYYDLRTAMRFVITGDYEYKGVSGHVEPEQKKRDLLRDNLKTRGVSAEIIDRLMDEPENFNTILASIPGLEEELRLFSPAAVVSDLKAPLLINHNVDDLAIPHTESLRFADAAQEIVPTTLSITSIFVHGDIKPISRKTLVEDYIPSLSGIFKFLYQLLSYK